MPVYGSLRDGSICVFEWSAQTVRRRAPRSATSVRPASSLVSERVLSAFRGSAPIP